MSLPYRSENLDTLGTGNKNKYMSYLPLGGCLIISLYYLRQQISSAELVVENGAAMAWHRHWYSSWAYLALVYFLMAQEVEALPMLAL